MRRYEWLTAAILIASGLICFAVAGGGVVWGTHAPDGPLGRVLSWLMDGMPYLMVGFGLLWAWAVWGLVSSIWRERREWVCWQCRKPAEPDWRLCPYCGAQSPAARRSGVEEKPR